MAPVARTAPASSTGASSDRRRRPTARARVAGRPSPPDRRRAAGGRRSPTTLTAIPARLATKASQTPIGPQMGVEHQQTGPVAVTFTRFGYWAV